MATDLILDDLDRLPDGSLSQAEVKWLTAEIRRVRAALVGVLPHLGALGGMTHNGHLAECPLAFPDWIATDPCTCGREELIERIVAAIDGGEEGSADDN